MPGQDALSDAFPCSLDTYLDRRIPSIENATSGATDAERQALGLDKRNAEKSRHVLWLTERDSVPHGST